MNLLTSITLLLILSLSSLALSLIWVPLLTKKWEYQKEQLESQHLLLQQTIKLLASKSPLEYQALVSADQTANTDWMNFDPSDEAEADRISDRDGLLGEEELNDLDSTAILSAVDPAYGFAGR